MTYSTMMTMADNYYNIVPVFLGFVVICCQRLSAADEIDVHIYGNGYSGLVQITLTKSVVPDSNRHFSIRRDRENLASSHGYLCDDNEWKLNTAEVICRQLGHSSVKEVLHNAENIFNDIEPDMDTIFVHELSCEGTETSLSECTYDVRNVTRCSKLAGVTCNVKSNNSSHSSGIITFVRMFMAILFIPVFTMVCVACKCCHRHCRRKRRHPVGMVGSRPRNQHQRQQANWQARMAASDLEDLPSYDEIMRDSSVTCTVTVQQQGRRDSGCFDEEEEEPEEPPPSYESLIGVVLEDQTHRDHNQSQVI